MKKLIFLLLLLFSAKTNSSLAEPEPFSKGTLFGVFKASYGPIKSQLPPAVGGICGTAFFIAPQSALSAHHVLSPNLFIPNPGYTHVQVWLANGHDAPLEINPEQLEFHPEVDATLVKFKAPVVNDRLVFELALTLPLSHDSVTLLGFHLGSGAPKLEWKNGKLALLSLSDLTKDERSGPIENIIPVTIQAEDIQMHNIVTFHLAVGARVGMSGGPTLLHGRVIGLNSFGLPANQEVKTESYSVSIFEIQKHSL